MKRYLLALGFFFFVVADSLHAQQSSAQNNLHAKPHVINFSALAAYQLQHPVKKKHHQFVEQGEDRDKNFKFKPKPVNASAVKFNVTLPKISTRSVSPSPDISFTGTLDNDYLIPPDVDGVAGDSLIMETNNQEFDIFTKSGFLLEAVDLNTFFASAGSGFVFDPHIIYDAQYKKYIVCADCLLGNGYGAAFIGVTQTNDPTGNWNLYGVTVMTNPSDFLDFPMIGYNKNWIVVTFNDFITDTSAWAQINVFNKDSMYNDSTVTVKQFIDSNIYSLSPAITADTSLNTEYLVADWNGDSSNNYGYVRLYTLTGTVDSPVYTPMQFMGVNYPWSENPVHAAQLGNSANPLETVDTRIDYAKYINGSLWFSHTVYLPADSPTYCAVDWWQVDPATPTLQQFGRIGDTTGNTFYFFPSINVNANNDALLGYSTSSYTSYVSTGYVYRAASDAPNTMEGGYIYQPGLAPYFKTYGGGRNRWGDFSGTAVDPTNNSFWTFQEYANQPANNWGTVIANVTAPTCTGTPDAGVISAAKDTICSGSTAILQLNGNTIAENEIQVQWQQSASGISDWADVNSSVSTVPSQFISAPLNQTTYFRCQVTCTNSNETATSATMPVYVYGLLSVSNDTVCTAGTYNFVADAIGNTKWYSSSLSATPLSISNTLRATVANDTTFYITVGDTASYRAGIVDSTVGTGGIYSLYDKGLEFSALNDFMLDSVFVYPYDSGTVVINLVDNYTSIVLQSDTFSLPASSIFQKTKLPLKMSIEGGYDYKLNASGTTDYGLFMTNSGVTYPYVVPGIISINRPIDFFSNNYYFFYDWHLSSLCSLTRIPVPVTIDTTTILIVAKPDTVCNDDSVVLSASGAATYKWLPGNITGSTIKVKPTVTTIYYVVGTDRYGCSGSSAINVVVKNCVTGVGVASTAPGVKIYPNPASDVINVQIEGTIPGNTYLEIDNVLGQRLFLNQIDAGATTIQPVSVSSFPAGIYFYKLKSGNEQIAAGKFVKE